MNFTENVRKAYEAYLLGNKEECFKILIPGTKDYYYLKLIDAFKTEKHNLSKDTKALWTDFQNNFHGQEKERLRLREVMLRYDGASNTEERKKIIDEINAQFVYGNFSHAQPGNLKSKAMKDQKAKTDPAKHSFKQDSIFSEKTYIEQFYSRAQSLTSAHKCFMNKVDFKKIHEDDFYNYISSSEDLADIDNDSFLAKFGDYLSQKYKKDKHFYAPEHIIQKLTIDQLETLGKKCKKLKEDKHFIGSVFQKKFHYYLDDGNKDTFSLLQRREQLEEMYKESKGHPQSFRSALLFEILENGLKTSIFSKDYFIEYLKNPLKQWHMNTKKVKHENIDYTWNQYLGNMQSNAGRNPTQNNDKTLYKQYLEQFYRSEGSLKAFEDFFDTYFIQETFEEFEFLAGKDLKKAKIDATKFEQLVNTVKIELIESNAQVFKKEDRVRLHAELKNVPTLYVKIFEFNSENYYRKNLAPFKTDVNLDGLIASHEVVLEFEEPSMKKFSHIFEFPQLDNRVGLFVIEFISNGYSSRAVIKKGSLSLIHSPTIAGHAVYILDENKEICKTENTGIFFENNYFKCDPEAGGRVLIPYEKRQTQSKAILLYDGFAQLADFTRKTEEYQFNAGFVLHPESLLMGNEAVALVRPMMRVNGRQCPLNLLKNAKITLVTLSSVDSIPVTKTFDNIKIEHNKDIEISFQVPPNLDSVTISFEAEVRNITTGQVQKMYDAKSYQMTNHKSTVQFYEAYLRKHRGDYHVYLLGKNGEPEDDVTVHFNFQHTFYPVGWNGSSAVGLVTDSEGKINLGPLENITRITANIAGGQHHNFNRVWTLPSEKEVHKYPQMINALEGEPITIPFPHHEISTSNFMLVRKTSGQKIISNNWKNAKLQQLKGHDFGNISIEGLQNGHYHLEFKELSITIPIIIHQGCYWENDAFILKEHSLVENRQALNYIKISDFDISKKEEKKEKDTSTNKVSFKISDHKSGRTRVHVYAFQFMPTAPYELYNQMNQVTVSSCSLDVFSFAKWKNIYLNNRKLGDEFRYVFDRRYTKRFIGNTLERPSLLLKRNFMRNTDFDQEVVNTGNVYQAQVAEDYPMMQQQIMPEMSYQQMPMQQMQMSNCAPQMMSKMAYGGAQQNRGGRYAGGADFRHQSHQANLEYLQQDYRQFQNFLQHCPFTAKNLQPDANGVVSCDFDVEKYSTIMIIAADPESTTQKMIDIEEAQAEIAKRDLTLDKPLNPEKCYNEVRNSSTVNKGELFKVEDITSTELQTIDSMEKVKQVQEELLRLSGQNVPDYTGDFSFLLKWHEETEEEKNKKFTKFFCHELNLFIYYKDPDYFKKVVGPFINNKMEKTFIDNWLLDNYLSIKHFANVENFEKLNAFEKCLLIEMTARNGDKVTAKDLADKLVLDNDASPINVTGKNKIFDTVLNLNMLSTENEIDALREVAVDAEMAFNESEEMLSMERELYTDNRGMSRACQRNFVERSAPQSRLLGKSAAPQRMARKRMAKRVVQEESKYALDDMMYDLDGGENLAEARRKQPTLFQELDSTKEYQETNYYKRTGMDNANIVKINDFWVDYAQHCAEGKSVHYLSPSFIMAAGANRSSSLTELVALLSIIDLPSKPASHKFQSSGGRGVEINTASNMIVFKKEIKEAESDFDTNLLVIHRFYEFAHKNTEKKLKEFLTNEVYGCEVIITNVSAKSQDFQLLWQIPEGSVPLKNTNYQKSKNMKLSPYTTTTFDFFFYFPKAGTFKQFPSNITINDIVVGKANECILNVVTEREIVSFETFRDILASGDKGAVLDFLSTANLVKGEKGFNFSDILWLLSDKEFFMKAVSILRKRRIYNDLVWKYGFKHHDEESVKESLSRSPHLVNQLGYFFRSQLISVAPTDRGLMHLDYFPLVNSRAHKLGDSDSTGILNRQFKQTFEMFLYSNVEKVALDSYDWLEFAYYLLLQDRINEAIELFEKVDPKIFDKVEAMKLQYDYISAYLDFFTGSETGFKRARKVANEYVEYPVISWRMLFLEIKDQLDEVDGVEFDDNQEIDQENEEKKKKNLEKSKKMEPSLDFALEGKKMNIEYMNIPELTIKYYVIDPEILFSRTPFLMQNNEDFAYVKPTRVEDVKLDKNLKSKEIVLDEEFQIQNVVIEVSGAGKQLFQTYFSTSVKVTIIENYGELKVTDQKDENLSQVYVKAFAKYNNGDVKFFKDGYTDIRGKFEYAQTNSNKLNDIQTFAIFIQSDKLGSLTRECKPPTNVNNDSKNEIADLGFAKPQQAARYMRHQMNSKSKSKKC